jgi:hypothetical protein
VLQAVKVPIVALVAGPPSPVGASEYPAPPLPATVVMVPLVDTLRTRLLAASMKNRLPARSIARPMGPF